MGIRNQTVALDTNEFVFALRRDPVYRFCETLLFENLSQLTVYVPLQVVIELQRNLTDDEMRGVWLALTRAKTVTWDYAPAPLELIMQWQQRGAKKGDAIIAAHLETADIRYFISENRHFLAELPALPFTVITSEQAIELLR
jgi:predicted nucleic-acid-binding protein